MLSQVRPQGFQSNEAIFYPHEIFFSRTDSRGVIESCNSVFQRISQYGWDRLIGAPHKLIRHPDMPKGVFWLLWNYIQAGKPIGAYVKNLSEDGKYYWVFAIVTPIETGYLSVRIKPTSPLLETVEKTYADLLAQEQSEGFTPQQSAEILGEKLKALGFDTYADFMIHAIAIETESRSEILECRKSNMAQNFSAMLKSLEQVRDFGNNIVSEFESIKTTPLNMRIQAAHLGNRAASLSVISSNYQILALQIRETIGEFLASSDTVLKTIKQGLFLTCISGLQKEAIAAFDQETDLGASIKKQDEITRLNKQCSEYDTQASAGLSSIEMEVRNFTELCTSLKRVLSGLSLTRILCEMESKRIGNEAQNMSDIAAQLNDFQTRTGTFLKKIEEQNWVLKTGLDKQKSVSRSELPSRARPRRSAA